VNIYLIGYRGTGKSSVAPRLADRLGRSWIDLDHEIEKAGRSIAQIFAEEGEQAFRDMESAALAEADRIGNLVVATGGGVIGRRENREILARGRCLWLTARPLEIARRLAADQANRARRPQLTQKNSVDEIRTLLAKRRRHYKALAQLVLDGDSLSIDELVDAATADCRAALGAPASSRPQR
jgi:shikimate kinase